MRIKKILASEIAALDSDVLTGGGTDDTEALQKALDEALTCGGVHLVMDGAALIRGLRVHSNTTIECLSKDCGFYLADDSNCAVVTNADWQMYHLDTRNVTLIGGTYNHNCLHQLHHLREKPGMRPGTPFSDMQCVFAMEFYGVENLLVRDVIIRNQRTYAFMCACFKKVTIENVWLDLIDYMPRNNQDGFHFWGPGQFLTVRNVGGRVGDDFMNIGPDEHDMKSSITDVLVDGVFLDDADQAIRLLTRDQGRLDRVTIRNVTGVYHGLCFYINPWFTDGHFGNFGSLFGCHLGFLDGFHGLFDGFRNLFGGFLRLGRSLARSLIDHAQLHRRLDVAIQRHLDRMLADSLDGLADFDAATIDLDALLGKRIDDHLGGDGAKQNALVTDLRLDGELCGFELGLQLLGVGDAHFLALGDVVAALLELFEVALRRLDGDALDHQMVGETAGNLDDVAFAALVLEFFEENDFHVLHLETPLIAVAATTAAVAHCGDRVRHEGHGAGALHGVRDVALVLHASARHAARLDLAAVGDVLAKQLRVFVVDVIHLVLAELAVLTTRLLAVISHWYVPLS